MFFMFLCLFPTKHTHPHTPAPSDPPSLKNIDPFLLNIKNIKHIKVIDSQGFACYVCFMFALCFGWVKHKRIGGGVGFPYPVCLAPAQNRTRNQTFAPYPCLAPIPSTKPPHLIPCLAPYPWPTPPAPFSMLKSVESQALAWCFANRWKSRSLSILKATLKQP